MAEPSPKCPRKYNASGYRNRPCEREPCVGDIDVKRPGDYLRLGYLPLTCARSIPFSAASFLASGLANTRPFLGAAGAAAAGAGLGAAAAGAAAWNINTITSYMYKVSKTEYWPNSVRSCECLCKMFTYI